MKTETQTQKAEDKKKAAEMGRLALLMNDGKATEQEINILAKYILHLCRCYMKSYSIHTFRHDMIPDLAMTAFYRVWREIWRFKAGKASLSSYVYIIVRSAFYDFIRSELQKTEFLKEYRAFNRSWFKGEYDEEEAESVAAE